MTIQLYDLIGITGAVLIFLGFYRTSIGRWSNKSFWYELDNMVGATLLIIYQLHLKAFISVILNTLWVIVAFRGLTSFAARYKWGKKKKAGRRK